MGKAILDIWFRDEKCRPIYNLEDRERWDWVEIYNCMGELVGERVRIPPNEAHVRVEVPPGCYKIKGFVCEHRLGLNEATDAAIAIVQCGQEQCVDLISPTIQTCVENGVHAIVQTAATIPEITPDEIKIAVKVMLAAAKISPKEMTQEIAARRDFLADVKEARKTVIPRFDATLDLLKTVDVRTLK